MTVSLARPGACWVAPKNIVLAGAGAASILLPQLPQNRLPFGTSAPQFGQSIPAFSAALPASQARPWRSAPGGSPARAPKGLERRGPDQRVSIAAGTVEWREPGRPEDREQLDRRQPGAPGTGGAPPLLDRQGADRSRDLRGERRVRADDDARRGHRRLREDRLAVGDGLPEARRGQPFVIELGEEAQRGCPGPAIWIVQRRRDTVAERPGDLPQRRLRFGRQRSGGHQRAQPRAVG